MNLVKKIGLGLTFALFAACGYPSHQLGHNADDQEPELKGTTKTEVVFKDGDPEDHLTINAKALKPENKYIYENSLTINGNIPAKTVIIVENGKLVVNGDVGAQSELQVHAPERTHQKTDIVLVPIYHSTGKSGYTTLTPMPVTETIIDGLLYPQDNSPGVEIHGSVRDSVKISVNGGIAAEAFGKALKMQTGYGRPVTRLAASYPVAARPAP